MLLETPEGYYSRLCPGDSHPQDPAKLKQLALLMKAPPRSQRAAPVPGQLTMPSGYVYFGQLIDHDLNLDRTPAHKASPDVKATPNYRTPCLDLDPIYGKDPAGAAYLYTANGELRLGETAAVTLGFPPVTYRKSCDDLLRDANGRAMVIDSRSDQNLLIAQLQVFWCKLHNRILRLAPEREDLLAGIPAGSLLEGVRRLVIWIYQWVVVHDFLPYLVQNSVWNDVFQQGQLRLFTEMASPGSTPFALPVEFTSAAFRFGHSMVRDKYGIRSDRVATTAELLAMTKAGGGIRTCLPANFVVEWDFFFEERPLTNRGEKIDTFIAEALYNLSSRTIAHTDSGGIEGTPAVPLHSIALPELTLLRGSNIGLASGEAFARHFDFESLAPRAIPAADEIATLFQDEEFRGRTPLWYYILREAAVAGVYERGPRHRNLRFQKMGLMGSRIITEVLFQTLMADPNSILRLGRHWSPPGFSEGKSSHLRRLDSLPHLHCFIAQEE